MNTSHSPAGDSGEGIRTVPGHPALDGFEERLLAELKLTVAQQSVARPSVARQAVPTRRLRQMRRRGVTAQRPPYPHRPPRRRVLAGAAAIATASGVAVALAMAWGSPDSGHAVPGRTIAALSPSSKGPAALGPANTAAGVMHNAALAALQVPAGAPRPDQFVYSKVVLRWPGGGYTQQGWISADGARFGLEKITGGGNQADGTVLLPSCRNGFLYNPRRSGHCAVNQEAGYLPGMPANQGALRPYLLRVLGLQDDPGNAGGLLFSIENMMTTQYLLPQQRAALYEFLAHLPGLAVVHRVTNLQGTPGIGVRVSGYKGGEWTIIFDPKTYTPLGMNWTRLGKQAGQVQVKLAIVDKAGQLP